MNQRFHYSSRRAVQGVSWHLLLQFISLLLAVLPTSLWSQIGNTAFKTPRTHIGTDFWFAIPPNFHTAQLDGDDKISLVISADRPTQGEIRFADSAGRATVLRLSIQNPAQPFTVEIPAKDVELQVNEQVSRRSFHILTENPVSVYALNTAHQSADGMLVFPSHAAGKRFITLGYPSDDGVGLVPKTPSQLGVVATENATRVRITPSAPTKLHGTTPHEITLQQGETYLLQADATILTAADLTGTVLEASKPIVVISSHERANVPISSLEQIRTRSISRDYMLEQLLPLEYWGRSVIVPPLPIPQTSVPDVTSHIVRVLASGNATQIRINGRLAATLQAGQFYETTLASAPNAAVRGLVIEGSEPIAVAVYASSNGSGSGISDPFMLSVPPQEQYLKGFRSVSVRSIQRISRTITEEAFREHYLTIIAPLSALASIRLDNQALANGIFERLSAPSGSAAVAEYVFAHVRVNAGVHTISADAPLGVLAFGYGNATSYGFPAGQRLELDNLAPRILTQATCGMVRGVVYDSATIDSKLFRVSAPDSLRRNIVVDGLGRLISSDSLVFTARLVNPYQDGRTTIMAWDSLGQVSLRHLEISGLTVHADTAFQATQILTSSATLITGRTACFQLSLVNYGKFPKQIDSLGFLSGRIRVNAMLPLVLQPNERRTIEYCVLTSQSGEFIDTLAIGDGCRLRPILAVNVETFADTTGPLLREKVSECERKIEYIASDNGRFRTGISAELIAATHCTVQIERLPNANLRIVVTLLNRKSDAYYKIIVSDSAGNTRTIERRIPGLFLRYTFAGMEVGRNVPLQFTAVNAAAVTCATLFVENMSAFPIQLDTLRLGKNITFSIPPSELPLRLAAGEAKPLRICFAPTFASTFHDTLFIEKFCERETLSIVGAGVDSQLEAISRCNALLRLHTRTKNTLEISILPQPASEELTITIASKVNIGRLDGVPLHLNVFDTKGIPSAVNQEYLSFAAPMIHLETRQLPIGLYFYQLSNTITGEIVATGSILILR